MENTNDYDILDDDGDLMIENGDIVIGDGTLQHIRDILIAAPGHYKQYPYLGADIGELINGELDVELKKKIRMQLTSDGYTVNEIKMVNGVIEIDVVR